MAGNQSTPGRTVASKVVQVLAAFAGDSSELSLAELHRRTGLPSSTAHRLAQDLLREGILERSPDGDYRIGLRLWEIAARSVRGPGLREAAMPFLQNLYEATQQHVQLAVLDGDQALIVEKISGPHAVPTVGRAGGRLPLHASGVGKAILAHADAELQERILAGPLERFTPHTVTSPQALRAVLAQIRRDRTAYCHQELTLGAVSCAAPISTPESSTVASVSMVVTADQDVTLLAAAVRTAAIGIGRALQVHRDSGADPATWSAPKRPAGQAHRPRLASSGTVPASGAITAGTMVDGRRDRP
ncbi:IclR family transcriptional regulator [Streptomyces justiciae]|uniref:IclR family transcriptional regulator n=1 Tax=Streptomyces justiciae TaxID=2780140 RepID=UPI0021184D6B|nr:IclR family transcriptional regulator [Streptomyces justiciae]MCW8378646.1 IclR family transcriptional regulator [Streptomyces justiciae]